MSPAEKRATKPHGPKTLTGSAEARRKATLLLEALSGLRTTQEASDAMGIALARYYVLETRALQALVDGLEPQRRGRRVSHERRIAELQAEVKRLTREVLRYQALHRAATRAVGVKEPPKAKKASVKRTRGPRREPRVRRVLRSLAPDLPPAEAKGATLSSSADEGG